MPAGSHSGPESSNCCPTHVDCLAPVHCDPCRLQAVFACIERAAWAACAEGAVLPRLRRAVTAPGTKAGHGVQGAWGCPGPGPLPPAAQAKLFYVAFPPGRWHTAAMSIFTTSTPVIGRPENGEWPLVHPLACLPEPALAPPAQGGIPDDAACMALWDKYGMLDNIRAHSRLVAHIATELARRARAAGFPVNVAAVRASAMLHDIAKTYSVLHGGSHAQLGASWVVAETRNHALAQGVLLHVHWPWAVPER